MKTSTKILFLVIILSCILIYYITKSYFCKTCKSSSLIKSDKKKIKGICYFDIDDTLTTAKGDPDEIMKECLKNDFAIGIITASNRKVNQICNRDKAGVPWMSDILCKQFNENNKKMYNSTSLVAGESIDKVIKNGWPVDKINYDPGFVKGWDMEYGKRKFYKDVPDKCIVLFDDQKYYMDGVKRFNSEFEVECSNKTCGANNVLDKEMVRIKIEKMKKNGCK